MIYFYIASIVAPLVFAFEMTLWQVFAVSVATTALLRFIEERKP